MGLHSIDPDNRRDPLSPAYQSLHPIGDVSNLNDYWAHYPSFRQRLDALVEVFLSDLQRIRALMLTADEILVLDAPDDAKFGTGPDLQGENVYGQALMHIRSFLRREPLTDRFSQAWREDDFLTLVGYESWASFEASLGGSSWLWRSPTSRKIYEVEWILSSWEAGLGSFDEDENTIKPRYPTDPLTGITFPRREIERAFHMGEAKLGEERCRLLFPAVHTLLFSSGSKRLCRLMRRLIRLVPRYPQSEARMRRLINRSKVPLRCHRFLISFSAGTKPVPGCLIATFLAQNGLRYFNPHLPRRDLIAPWTGAYQYWLLTPIEKTHLSEEEKAIVAHQRVQRWYQILFPERERFSSYWHHYLSTVQRLVQRGIREIRLGSCVLPFPPVPDLHYPWLYTETTPDALFCRFCTG